MPDVLPLDPPPPATLAPAAGALPGGLRPVLDRLQRLAFRAVQLDARSGELRPSTLSMSGRRDVLATLRRRELTLAGLDCLVPPGELTGRATADAAIAAVIEVIRLAADLGRVPVSMRLPSAPEPDAASSSPAKAANAGRSPILVTGGDVELHAAVASMPPGPGAGRSATPGGRGDESPVDLATIAFIAAAADRHGVAIVDHAVPLRRPAGPLVPGVDVAAVLAAGADPMLAMATAGDRLGGIRLSDLTGDGRRVPVGHPEGRLGIEGFAAAVAAGDPVPLVLDVRQCGDAWASLVAGAAAWTEVTP